MQPPQAPTPPPVSFTDLTTTDIALLAVTATILAALVAALSAIVVAIVNAIASRKQARAVAHRDYLMRTLQPVLDYTEGVAKGHELVHFAIRKSDDELHQAVQQAEVKFDNLSGIGLVMRTPTLREKWQELKRAESELYRLIGEIDRERAHRAPLGPVEDRHAEALKPLRQAVVDFRAAVERFVF